MRWCGPPLPRRRSAAHVFLVLAVAAVSFALLQSLVIPVLSTIRTCLGASSSAVAWLVTGSVSRSVAAACRPSCTRTCRTPARSRSAHQSSSSDFCRSGARWPGRRRCRRPASQSRRASARPAARPCACAVRRRVAVAADAGRDVHPDHRLVALQRSGSHATDDDVCQPVLEHPRHTG